MSRLLDFAADDFGNELGSELCKSAGRSFALYDLGHFLADGSDLRRGSICSFLNLIRAALGEGNGEETEEIVIGGLDGYVRLDQ